MTSTANGKSVLALLDDQQIDRIASRELDTKGSAEGSVQDLLDEIAHVRERGFALDLNEHTVGISAVGVSFTDSHGRIYAASIPAPSQRFEQNQDELTENLLRTVEQIKQALG